MQKSKKAALSGGGEGLLTYLYIINRPYHGVAYVANVSVQFWKKEQKQESKSATAHITRDMCFPGRGVHITGDMCSPT